jgi:squalene-associated FAD-dependent desaturase
MPSVLIAGGGLAGLAAAAALGGAGFEVDLYEARSFLGGRATSYTLPSSEGSEVIDNCQHVLLACFTNLLALYDRLGVRDRIRFFREFHFIEPGGRVSTLRAGALPAPLHFFRSFASLRFLTAGDKLALARGMRALEREHSRADLDRITMLEWLREKGQPPRAIGRFWGQVLVSAVNEELERMSARHGFQVFRQAFLIDPRAHHMGLSTVPLSELYTARGLANTTVHLKTPLDCFRIEGGRVRAAVVNGEERTADYYVCALPFERVPAAAPELNLDLAAFEHSPITGIHLWFDQPVMDLPQATLLDRTAQWAFNKGEGRYVQLVVSASRSLIEMPRQDVIDLALRELAEFFPRAAQASLVKAHVVKEVRATFSARTGLEEKRPPARTAIPNLFLAGDWTRTGWPATMEGAVRSGFLATGAVAEAAGRPRHFLIEP